MVISYSIVYIMPLAFFPFQHHDESVDALTQMSIHTELLATSDPVPEEETLQTTLAALKFLSGNQNPKEKSISPATAESILVDSEIHQSLTKEIFPNKVTNHHGDEMEQSTHGSSEDAINAVSELQKPTDCCRGLIHLRLRHNK